ncbi:MAG TPA: hypothetical protein VMZ31_04685, partial [Phycisphaerae bacterium]|nr:hypothetical protein [Phycisphaerae bacterium]
MAFIPPQTSPAMYGQQVGQMGQQVGQMQVAHNLGMGQIWSDLIRDSIGSIIEEKRYREEKRAQEKAQKDAWLSNLFGMGTGAAGGAGAGALLGPTMG